MSKFCKVIRELFSKRPFIVFVDNLGFVNRGDQLMVQAVIDQIRQHKPEALIAVRSSVFAQNSTNYIADHIYPLQFEKGIKESWLYRMMVNFLLRQPWIIAPKQVDLVLNCRGFYLSDNWCSNEDKYLSEVRYNAWFTNPKTKFVYLPQAFGPFCNEWARKSIELIYKRASVLYARDASSYRFLTDLFPNSTKIKQAPDFTCLVEAENNSAVQLPIKSYSVVILNCRMIDKTDASISGSYLLHMRTIVEHLLEKGESVILLNHEGRGDEMLMEDLNEKLSKRLPILTRLNGREVKSIIKNAKFVISSRYHGVVSSLNQSVPVVSTAWSHKYIELLSDMGCSRSLLDVTDMATALQVIDDALDHPGNYIASESSRILMVDQVRAMWEEVFSY